MHAPAPVRSPLRWLVLAALALTATASAVRADEPDPVFAPVQAAVAAGQTQNTAVKGFHDPNRAFTELPGGKVLIGFECGLGKFLHLDAIYALRAIYRTPDGVSFGPEHGRFPKPGGTALSSRVVRTVRVQAPPGYAVGGVTLRTGLNLNGLGLMFMRLDGPRLDPRDVRESPWVGDRTGGSESFLGGDGAIVVGLFGSQDELHVQSLGLITVHAAPLVAQVPAGPRPLPPAAALPDDEEIGPAEPARPSRKAPKGAAQARGWLPYLVFIVVAVGALVVSLALMKTRQQPCPPRLPSAEPSAALPPLPAAADPHGIQAGMPRRPPPFLAEPIVPDPPAALASRGVLRCGRCAHTIPADSGARPWCPHCGGDLKPTADTGAEQAPTLLQPPYFVGRLGRTFRIYVTPSQLLFIDCPDTDDRSSTERTVNGISLQFGLVGILIGSLIGGSLAGPRRAAARTRQWTLDLADTTELSELAQREPGSFSVDVDLLRGLRLEALGFWQRLVAERCAARLHFMHPVRGPLAVDLPRPDDVRVAIQQLTSLVGDRLDVNAAWDWGRQRFVPKG